MKDKTVKRLLTVIIGVGLLAVAYIYFSYGSRPKLEEVLVKAGNPSAEISLYGTVEPSKSVELSFENTGKINSITKNVGDFVKAGTVLVEQDLESSNVQLEQAKAGVNLAAANLKSAEDALSREKYKLKSLKNSSAATNDKKAQQAQIDSFENNIEAQKALLSQAQDSAKLSALQLSKRIIKAPFDGTIIKKNAEAGDLANPNVPNSSVLTMIEGKDVTALEVDVFASEWDQAKLKIGDVAKVTLDAYGKEMEFSAKISAIEPIATIKNGAAVYKVALMLDQKDARIKAGMNANVTIN